RRRIDVAALAAGRALAREHDVHFARSGERAFGEVPERGFGIPQLAHHLSVDVQQRARAGQLDDAAELLGAGARDVHERGSRRRSAPSITAIALAKIEPKSRKVTSTPSELEFGLHPNVACRTRPRRKSL